MYTLYYSRVSTKSKLLTVFSRAKISRRKIKKKKTMNKNNQVGTGNGYLPLTINNVPVNKVKTEERKYFHVFTDNKDCYFQFDNDQDKQMTEREKAFKKCEEYIKNGEENIRIYYVHEIDDEVIVEDCVYSKGNYPY